MDVTECFGFPYPQCDPPLTKDASDIEHLRDLALAVDAVVTDFNSDIVHQLVRPPAARLTNGAGGPLVSTLSDNVIFLDTATFDNSDGSTMLDATNGVMLIPTSGWYHVGVWVVSSVATDVQTRSRIIVNADPVTNFQGPSGLVTAGQQNLTAEDTLHLTAGDGVTIQTRNGSPGTSVSYTATLWAVLVAPDA